MRIVDWVQCNDRSMAKRVCDRLIAIGARIINVTEDNFGDVVVVWFEYEGEIEALGIDKEALLKGDVT